MSIVRIGLGETKNFAEGYEAIFGKKEPAAGTATKKPVPKKKPAAKAKAAAAKPKKGKKK